MNPAGVSAGLASEEARRHIDVSAEQVEQVLTRSRSLTATQRLTIYGNAYFARLQECLRAEFPVLLHALGEKLFGLFTLDYLQSYPSRSYNLSRLGGDFPRYLAETRPDRNAPAGAREAWPDFIIDLATLERTFSELFDGDGVEGQRILDSNKLLATPLDRLPLARFVSVVCLRLLTFRYPVSTYFNAVRTKANPDLPSPVDTWLVMVRRNYVVQVCDLTQQEYELLSALRAGRTLREITSSQTDPDAFVAGILPLLKAWADKGFFAGVEFN